MPLQNINILGVPASRQVVPYCGRAADAEIGIRQDEYARDIAFVILTWNSASTIGDCLRSIRERCEAEMLDYEVIIVDNGSKDGTAELVRSLPLYASRIGLISLPRNVGTTISRNMALRLASARIVCVMDSDAVLAAGSIAGIIRLLVDKAVGIVAPKLVSPDGTVQNSVKKFPSLWAKLAKIPRIVLKVDTPNYDWYSGFPFEGTTDVDCAISACWFFSVSLLGEIGMLDENIFYAPEDVDFCLRTRKAQKRVIYYPHFTVLHHCRHITHSSFFSGIALSHAWGLLYYFCKHRYLSTPSLPCPARPAGECVAGENRCDITD